MVGLKLLLLADAAGTGGELRHSGRTGGVVALRHHVEDFVGRDAPVVGVVARPVLARLQLVAQTPEDDGGAVAVALHPLFDELGPQRGEGLAAAPVFVVAPLVDELVHHEQTHAVGNLGEALAVGVVGAAYGVETESFHLAHLALDGVVEGGSTQSTQVVMVGDALEEHLLAVELEAEVGAVFDGAYAELGLLLVHQDAVVKDVGAAAVEIGRLGAPELGVQHRHGHQLELVGGVLRELVHRVAGADNLTAVGGEDCGNHFDVVLAESRHLHLDLHGGLLGAHLRGVHIESVTGDMRGVLHLEEDVAEETAAGVPARAVFLARRGAHGHHVEGVVAQSLGHVALEAAVSVFRRTDLLPVHPHVAVVHDAAEVQQHLAAHPQGVGLEGLAIPALAHRLEAACAAGALVPGQLKLEVVGQRELAPGRIVVAHLGAALGVVETPVEVEQDLLGLPERAQGHILFHLLLALLLILLRVGCKKRQEERRKGYKCLFHHTKYADSGAKLAKSFVFSHFLIIFVTQNHEKPK